MAPPLRAGQRQGGINIFTPSATTGYCAAWATSMVLYPSSIAFQVRRFTTPRLTNADADKILADATTVLQTNDDPGDLACATDLVRVGDVTAFTEGNGSVTP